MHVTHGKSVLRWIILITDNNRQLPSTTDNYRQQAGNYRQQADNYRQQADNYRQQANTYFHCILIVIWLFLRKPKLFTSIHVCIWVSSKTDMHSYK
jgi:hypothetical protein